MQVRWPHGDGHMEVLFSGHVSGIHMRSQLGDQVEMFVSVAMWPC